MRMSRGLCEKVLFIFRVCLRHSPPPATPAIIPRGYRPRPARSGQVKRGKVAKNLDYLLGNEERSATAGLDSDLTEQEKTLLAVYRASSEEVKLRIIQAVMNVKDESEKTHRVYRAARSSDNAEPVIVTRSQEDIDRLRNAKAVTCDEDL